MTAETNTPGAGVSSAVMKLSQDTTNELWSVTLCREYETPGAKKRAIELNIRAAIEAALASRELPPAELGEGNIRFDWETGDPNRPWDSKVITHDEMRQRYADMHRQAMTPPPASTASTLDAQQGDSLPRQSEAIKCYVATSKESCDAGPKYWVTIERDGKTITPYHTFIRGRADYEVASWDHLLNGAPEPDILAYDTDAPTTPPAAQVAAPGMAGEFVLRVPWGSWRADGVWQHNPLLQMSEAAQRAENIANGYLPATHPTPAAPASGVSDAARNYVAAQENLAEWHNTPRNQGRDLDACEMDELVRLTNWTDAAYEALQAALRTQNKE